METLQTLTFLSCVYQYFFHQKWWSGFLDSLRLFIFHAHQRRKSYVKQSITASDGEQYTIWTPKTQKCLYDPTSRQHIWICAPGGMESIDLGMTALHRQNIFKQSKICMFNNPGISNKLKKIPLPSPTNTQYLIEYIQYLQTKHNLDVSLIGFSIGSVQVLRTLHTLSNTDKYSMYTHTHLHISKSITNQFVCFCRRYQVGISYIGAWTRYCERGCEQLPKELVISNGCVLCISSPIFAAYELFMEYD